MLNYCHSDAIEEISKERSLNILLHVHDIRLAVFGYYPISSVIVND